MSDDQPKSEQPPADAPDAAPSGEQVLPSEQPPADAPDAAPSGEGCANAELRVELEAEVQAIQEEIDEVNQEMERLRKEGLRLENEKTDVQNKLRDKFPPPTAAQAIRHYLDGQQKAREDRGQQAKALAQLGFGNGKLLSPIDRVRQRRNGYGNAPVQHPLL